MRRFGLIGRPLIHSASARYFAEKFVREGIRDCRYELFELHEIGDLRRLVDETPDLCGFNVTIPYKQQVVSFLDNLSPEAERIGAVNCVKRDGDRLTGYNTDVDGVRASLAELIGDDLPEKALVLGTGGASRAVQYVLAEKGIPFALVSRDPAKGDFTYDSLSSDEVASCRLIVNATPVGTFPHADEAPRIPYAALTAQHYLFDLVYNPPLTRFLDRGQQRGAHIRNGDMMFVRQAEVSWRIWNGKTPNCTM